MQEANFQRRHVACKLRIADILNSAFAKDEASAGYIRFNNSSAFRVNIIATLIYKSENPGFNDGLIDDGTGKIQLRIFESTNMLSRIDVGDVALIIGRVREFNNERYIVPEIIKKLVDTGWFDVRKLESLSQINSSDSAQPETSANDYEKVYLAIKNFDSGDGAAIEDLVKSFGKKADEMISRLLENGDVFEIKPGKLKVLE